MSKARRAFFAFGALGAFSGKLNPLSGKAIYETCVVPILLYGCENWVLTNANIITLESFQSEIGRRILQLSKFHSLLSTRVGLQLQSITSRIFHRKLSLLHRVITNSESIGHKIYSSLAKDSPCHLSLVRECFSLEEKLGYNGLTQEILDGVSVAGRSLTKRIVKQDWNKCLHEAKDHQSTAAAAEIASSTSWLKLWDIALDQGHLGTSSLKILFRELTRPSFGSKPCRHCDIDHLREPYFHHFITCHSNIGISPTIITRQLADGDQGLFIFVKQLIRTST